MKLPEYICYGCKNYKPEVSPEQSVVGDRIWKLFSILETWKPSTGGITLELNAYSPSDSEHGFKHYYFIFDDEGPEAGNSTHDGDGDKISSERHDPKHGWINGRQVEAPSKSATQELFQSIDTGSQVVFPRVDVVTCFIIRRQLCRCLRPLDLSHMLESFPQLEGMIYEPWRPWEECGDHTPISVSIYHQPQFSQITNSSDCRIHRPTLKWISNKS